MLRRAAQKRAALKDLTVVGITGSYGKTSTKEFLAAMLSEKFRVVKTKEHQNSEIGVARAILNDVNENHEVFIVEMGAYNKGGIKLLCDIAQPRIGILTGINEQHLATFGSQENIKKAKYELIESLPKDGLAVFNGNNAFCRELYEKTNMPKKICCTRNSGNCDLWAEGIGVQKELVFFRVVTQDGEAAHFKLNLLGTHNIENIVLAAQVAKELGMSLEEIARACERINTAQGAMQLKAGVNGLHIIDASYSANPEGVMAALEHLKLWDSKKIVVMPCLIELGGSAKEIHQGIGEKISEVADLAIITTKDYFEEIKAGSTSSPQAAAKVLFIENPQAILKKIAVFAKPGDVVLLEGRVPKVLGEKLLAKQ